MIKLRKKEFTCGICICNEKHLMWLLHNTGTEKAGKVRKEKSSCSPSVRLAGGLNSTMMPMNLRPGDFTVFLDSYLKC